MAHNLEIVNGQYSYIGRRPAWHKFGTVTGKYNTWSEILNHGALNFSVVVNQLEFEGVKIDAWGTFRTDTGVFLGPVGKGYTAIQHELGFEMVDALVGAKDGAHYETAGVLGKGEKVWGAADLNQRVKIGGSDTMNVFLLFSTSHDGSLSYNFRLVFERPVCENTLTAALGERTKASFTVRHTTNAQKRIADAHAVLANMGDDIKRVEDKLNFLAQRKMTRESMTTIFDRLFPKRTKEDGTAVVATRRENILADVLKVYEMNDGNAFPEQRGTAYNLLNAITGYVDHERSTKADGREESAIFGSGDALKTKAFEILLATAPDLPSVPVQQYVVERMPIQTNVPLLDQILETHVAV